ncbi:hypothetical protein PR003_g11156 [Phytophthora rubi]|uniref:Uncharacterized protein n=1 Tax=Phytophthora rubi TaxID=129364 RepID=A0A6A3KTQ9_9STRA|nr:hypothetical protein PR001_g16073 [Phytophthora rubi]KAE9028434.1 hypothetical protein PR002_g10399 [Phytophthora rubi]KAE9339135.1 hypothetical protein PR003_g11156 [Phytophthora rubi]
MTSFAHWHFFVCMSSASESPLRFVADLPVLVDNLFLTVACLVVESLAFETPSALLFVADDFFLALAGFGSESSEFESPSPPPPLLVAGLPGLVDDSFLTVSGFGGELVATPSRPLVTTVFSAPDGLPEGDTAWLAALGLSVVGAVRAHGCIFQSWATLGSSTKVQSYLEASLSGELRHMDKAAAAEETGGLGHDEDGGDDEVCSDLVECPGWGNHEEAELGTD